MKVPYSLLLLNLAGFLHASKSMPDSADPKTPIAPLESDQFAGNPEVQHFKRELEEGNLRTAWSVFSHDSDLRKYCASHLISLGITRVISMIGESEYDVRDSVLRALLIHASPSFISEIIRKVRPTNRFLTDSTSDIYYLKDMPVDNFVCLLGCIVDEYAQGIAVERSVGAWIMQGKTAHIDALIVAIGNANLHSNLVSIMVRRTFEKASACRNDTRIYVKRFFDHPAITAEEYSSALYSVFDYQSLGGELFHWLLEKADRRDLEAVKINWKFTGMEFTFQDAVKQAETKVGAESRHKRGREIRVAPIRAALTDHIAGVLLDVIYEYHLEW